MIKVSVIVPIYNGASYLPGCLNCILDQTLDEIEILCVNDASTDSTAAILRMYQEKDNRIKIITNEKNEGPGVSRNKGLKQAKGKYIIFLDADDIFERNMLQEAFYQAEICEADICIFREDFFQDGSNENMVEPYPRLMLEKLGKERVFSSKEVKNVVFNLWNGWAWDKLFRKEFVLEEKIYFQEMRSSEDGFFVHVALVTAKRITCLNKIFVHHRMDVGSSVSNSRNESWECCYLYLKELKLYLVKCGQYIEYEKSFINWASDFLYWNYRTLNEEKRKLLFCALKKYMLKDLDLLKYTRKDFYNPFYFGFIHAINDSDSYYSCDVPIEGTRMWISMLYQNEEKIEKMFQFLKKGGFFAAVWGLGERGKAFIEKYGNRNEIRKVYDQNSDKAGQIVYNKFLVEPFNKITCGSINFIIVCNANYYHFVVKTVKNVKPEIEVFNFEFYLNPGLSFPLSLEECL